MGGDVKKPGTKTLVVTDDEPDFRALIRNVGEKAGWCVVECENGLELTNTLRKIPDPSLIVLDVMMPKMDGAESLAWLAEKGISSPVCLVSGGPIPRELTSSRLDATRTPPIRNTMKKPVPLREFRKILDFIDF